MLMLITNIMQLPISREEYTEYGLEAGNVVQTFCMNMQVKVIFVIVQFCMFSRVMYQFSHHWFVPQTPGLCAKFTSQTWNEGKFQLEA